LTNSNHFVLTKR